MRALFVFAVAIAIAGCAADGGNDQAFVEKTYRTGSNIAVTRTPAGDGVTTVAPEDFERARDAAKRVVPPSGSH